MLKTIADNAKEQINSKILGQDAVTELALTAFFAGGHILLSGPTGLGKTTWAQAFASALGLSYGSTRVSEDAVPNNFLYVYTNNPGSRELKFQPGAFFSNVVQVEGIDSLYPRVYSFLIDSMDGHNPCITIADETYPLPKPHFFIASYEEVQNLAFADRFMMKLYVNYPGIAAEKQILQMHHVSEKKEAEPVTHPEAIAQAMQEVQAVVVEDAVFNYIVSITETTRRIPAVQTGASTRASISLMQAAKAYAAINGREYVTINDVRSLSIPVLRHRVTLRPEAVKQGIHTDHIIESIIASKRTM